MSNSQKMTCLQCKQSDYTDFSTCRFCGVKYGTSVVSHSSSKMGASLKVAIFSLVLFLGVRWVYPQFKAVHAAVLCQHPEQAIGHQYEVEPGKVLMGTSDAETSFQLWHLTKTNISEAQAMAFRCLNNSTFINLNQDLGQPNNSRDASKNGKLFFQVIGSDARANDLGSVVFKIKVTNKKHAGECWWLHAKVLADCATETKKIKRGTLLKDVV